MRDAVLHDVNRISLFGLKDVNPALISAMVVTAILLVAALLPSLAVMRGMAGLARRICSF